MLGEVEVAGDVTVARLHGELDLVNVDALRELVAGVVETSSPQVVIDLHDVPFVDVHSLSVILGAADELRESRRQLVIAGVSNSVRRLCELLNAEDILAPPQRPPQEAVPPAC
jgi:anti-sigma B factor antagonist